MGWQIDPFGHSREFASLLSAMGYDGLFLGRIDFQDKRSRLKNKEMEMLWRGDDDLGKNFFARLCYMEHKRVCDCKRGRLWFRFPLEEMKYLIF